MPEFRGDQLLKQWVLRAAGNGNVAAVGEGNHAQCIFQALTCSHVPGDYGDGADVEFRRVERQH